MKHIRKNICYFAGAALISGGISFYIYMISYQEFLISKAVPILYVLIPLTCILVIALIREIEKFKIAGIIIENQILHIKSAFLEITDLKNKTLQKNEMYFYVSNFGLLLDNRIIKFNQGNSQLKAVEIGNNHISIIYGTEQKMMKTNLLYKHPDENELEYIVEKFRFETGVVPVIRTGSN